MADPILGEIKIVGFNFAPAGFASCDGQLLPINQNQSLYSLLGTMYGGDGVTTFALPDLRGRSPMHVGASVGANHVLGESGGEDSLALSLSQVPAHTHDLNATNDDALLTDPESNVLARGATNFYGEFGTPTPMGAGAVSSAGAGQGHENMSPFLTLHFVIALAGDFPT